MELVQVETSGFWGGKGEFGWFPSPKVKMERGAYLVDDFLQWCCSYHSSRFCACSDLVALVACLIAWFDLHSQPQYVLCVESLCSGTVHGVCFRLNFLGYWRRIKAFASRIESELDGFQRALWASIWWEGSLIDKGLTKWPFPHKVCVATWFLPVILAGARQALSWLLLAAENSVNCQKEMLGVDFFFLA